MSILLKSKEDLKRYTNVIANILKVDVEIVDENINKIANTNIYSKSKNSIVDGNVYPEVLKTGKSYVIENPREHKLCKKCKIKDVCVEDLELCVPIMMNKKVIGVLGLVCNSIEKKAKILEDIDTYLEFLKEMSALLSAKVLQAKSLEENVVLINFLKEVTNTLDKGVVFIDFANKITQINNHAKKILSLNDDCIGKNIILSESNEFLEEGELFDLFLEQKTYHLVGKLIHSYSSKDNNKYIIIFNSVKEIKSKVLNLVETKRDVNLEQIVSKSDLMTAVKEKVIKIADTMSTVLVSGESGTGKELVSRAIHSVSVRKDKPFIAINCAAIPDTLLESELFGYVKGAFSGASSSGRIGKFELANGGILLLDEIAEMPLHLQSKLLRVLQERYIVKIGSNKKINIDVRIVAATNKNLRELVKENKFREDLYYRINVIPIELPALRERKEDIRMLFFNFLYKYNTLFKKNITSVDEKIFVDLNNYSWPGNIRELENLVELLINLTNDYSTINYNDLPDKFKNKFIINEYDSKDILKIETLEKLHIKKALDLYGYDLNSKKIISKKLGIGIATLYRKIAKYELE